MDMPWRFQACLLMFQNWKGQGKKGKRTLASVFFTGVAS